MSQAQPPQPPQPEEIKANAEFRRSENYFRVYVNQAEMGITPFDIRISLGELVGMDGSNVVIQRHGTIVMAPAQAKIFLVSLQQTIATFERQFGVIDISKVMQSFGNVQAPKTFVTDPTKNPAL
jgi:hypothetical protein